MADDYQTKQGPLYKPFQRLVRIHILGKPFEVPEGNILLRAFQFLAPDDVAQGRFCWNEECQYCRISYRVGVQGSPRVALACKLLVEPGMELTQVADEIGYCLRSCAIGGGK